MGINTLFNNYRTLTSYSTRCSQLASNLVNGKGAGNIIEIDDEAIHDIFFANGHIENYINSNGPVNDNDLVNQSDKITCCYQKIHEDVIKEINYILSERDLKLSMDGEDLKIKRK